MIYYPKCSKSLTRGRSLYWSDWIIRPKQKKPASVRIMG